MTVVLGRRSGAEGTVTVRGGSRGGGVGGSSTSRMSAGFRTGSRSVRRIGAPGITCIGPGTCLKS